MSPSVGLLQLGQRATEFYQGRLLLGGVGLETVATDFTQINALLPDGYEPLSVLLDAALKKFAKARCVIMPNITLHETFDKLLAHSPYASLIVHPLAAAIPYLKMVGATSVLVVGSRYTMQSDYLSDYLAAHGLRAVAPPEKSISLLDELRIATYASKESGAAQQEFKQFMEGSAKQQTVLVACTELSLLLPQLGLSSNKVIVDTAECQIQMALGQSVDG